MPDLFDPVRALYGEARPDGAVPSPDTLSDAARAEFEALAPVKAALDAQPTQQPDADVLAAVLDAARAAAVARTTEVPPARPRAADRAPAREPRARRMRVALPAVALLVCGAIGLGVFLSQPSSELTGDGSSMAEASGTETPVASEPLAEATRSEPLVEATVAARPEPLVQERPRPEKSAARSAAPTSAGSQPTAAEAAPPPSSVPPAAAPRSEAVADARGGEVSGAASAFAEPEAALPSQVARAVAPRVRMQVPVSTQPGVSLVAAEPTAWDTDDEDLRLLSLRLQTLRESNEGLAWDEPPVPLSGGPALQSRGLDLTSDTVHDETRVGFHALPQRAGWIRVQQGGQ